MDETEGKRWHAQGVKRVERGWSSGPKLHWREHVDLLILKSDRALSKEQLDRMMPGLEKLEKDIGMNVVLLDDHITGHVERDLQPLVDALTAQTEMMGRLVLALADSGADDGPEAPRTYMDGTPL